MCANQSRKFVKLKYDWRMEGRMCLYQRIGREGDMYHRLSLFIKNLSLIND